MRGLDLHTVCEEARCPNIGDCWNRGTATFMILGDVCTRACGFCAVKTGIRRGPSTRSRPPASRTPWRAWGCAMRSSRRSTATTSRTAARRCSRRASAQIRERIPGCTVEVLIPDFKGDARALGIVLDARPDILNHNTETVPRLYRTVRPGARFSRSLELLRRAKDAGLVTKSGIMLGLGEEWDEVREMHRARSARPGTDILTVGQYLRPSAQAPAAACATTRPRSSPRSAPSRRRSASATSSRARWCAPRTTPRSRWPRLSSAACAPRCA